MLLLLLPSPLLPQLPQLLLQLVELLPHVLLLLPLLPLLPRVLPLLLLLLAATAAAAAAQLLLLMLLLVHMTTRSWHHGPLGARVVAQTKFAQTSSAVDSGWTTGDPEPCDSSGHPKTCMGGGAAVRSLSLIGLADILEILHFPKNPINFCVEVIELLQQHVEQGDGRCIFWRCCGWCGCWS